MPACDSAELAFENARVLDLVQAMFGAISPNMRAISLECVDGGVLLRFLLAEESEVDREEIDDILFEFEALQERAIEIRSSVVVSSRPEARVELPGRWVFGRKEEYPVPPGGDA
ncbi:hypothetical protein, partial [Tautonia rosea]